MLGQMYRGLATIGPAPPPPTILRESRSQAASIGAVSFGGGEVPQPEPRDQLIRYYRDLVTVYRCASFNATSVASGKLRFYRPLSDGGREELTDPKHPLTRLFRRPNPRSSGYQYLWLTQIYLELVGDAMSEIVSKPALQLWPMNSSAVSPIVDPLRGITAYSYRPGISVTKLQAEEVWHVRFADPSSEIYGQSPLRAALRHVHGGEALDKALNAILRNGMRLSGVLSVEQTATPGQLDAVVAQLKELYSGVANWGKALVVAGGKRFQPLTMEPEKLQASELRKFNDGMILKAYGVWPLLFGEVDTSATRENATTQMRLYHEHTRLPRAKLLAEEISYGLLPRLQRKDLDDVYAELDYSETPVEKDMALDAARGNAVFVSAGIMTPNEIREQIGYEPLPWGDTYFGPSSTVPLADESGVIIPPPPPPEPELPTLPEPPPSPKAAAWKTQEKASVADIVAAARLDDDDPLLRLMRDAYRKIIARHGREAMADLPGSLRTAFRADTPELAEWVRDKTITFADQAFNHYVPAVRDVVAEGLKSGKTPQEIARILDEEVFSGRKSNALTVARTESVGSANRGQMAAFEQAGVERHEWVTQRDDSVREAHAALDGEAVSIGERFSNGLEFPGDTDHGEPGDTINCRCSVLPLIPGNTRSADDRGEEWKRFAARQNRDEDDVRRQFLAMVDAWQDRIERALKGRALKG